MRVGTAKDSNGVVLRVEPFTDSALISTSVRIQQLNLENIASVAVQKGVFWFKVLHLVPRIMGWVPSTEFVLDVDGIEKVRLRFTIAPGGE